MPEWFVYIIKCRDGSLYTGITTDLDKRIKCHNEGKASKYTRARTPVKLVYKRTFKNDSYARKEEIRIKQLARKDKLELIKL